MAISQDNRAIQIKTPFGKDALLVDRMALTEHFNQPFNLDLHLISEQGDLKPDTILGSDVTVQFALPSGGAKRFFHGFVAEFGQVGYAQRFHYYRATVRPWVWFLTRTSDCRIFQQKSIPQILEAVMKQYGFSDYKLKLKGTYNPFDYCVQYRETDFNFISRLMEQEGIFYFFEHADGKHTMVLADDANAVETVSHYDDIPYYAPTAPDAQRERDHVTDWATSMELRSGVYTNTDYDFQVPTKKVTGSATIARKHANAALEMFDWPAELPKIDSGEANRVAKIRVQELQATHLVAHGHGNAAGIATGKRFKLSKYPRSDFNIEWMVIGASLSATSDPVDSGRGGGAEFSIEVEAVDAKTPYRPPRLTPKPVVQGPQTAKVTGPSGEEIYTDKFGRIKVQFHWDREGKEDENASCWISVAQPWSGKNWGAVHIPRVGQEVVVAFLEGDPDRPFVIGSVWNGANMPPYELPANKTQSGVKSRSSKGGGGDNFNELRFEDKKGSEEVYLHAEKDQINMVENDRTTMVGRDKSETVNRNKLVHVVGNHTENIDGAMSVVISKTLTENVLLNYAESVAGGMEVSVGAVMAITVGAAMAETVGGARTENVGGSSTESVGKSKTLTVGKDLTESVKGEMTTTVEKDKAETVQGQQRIEVQKEFMLQAKKVQITADEEINLKTGSAEIVLKKNGDITIKGGKISVKGSGDVVIKGSKIQEN
ncbi:MAG TPA: type VI secretion system tip protein TssI/VgrG [Steroidobacteraceae bacterium]|jgi:type VI secretion system secreted protein VgrG|nr:type VI secretion system tip protein TssI/VgrG [Steroidobacteraceae bacterium]